MNVYELDCPEELTRLQNRKVLVVACHACQHLSEETLGDCMSFWCVSSSHAVLSERHVAGIQLEVDEQESWHSY